MRMRLTQRVQGTPLIIMPIAIIGRLGVSLACVILVALGFSAIVSGPVMSPSRQSSESSPPSQTRESNHNGRNSHPDTDSRSSSVQPLSHGHRSSGAGLHHTPNVSTPNVSIVPITSGVSWTIPMEQGGEAAVQQSQFEETSQGFRVKPLADLNDWRYGRTGWVRLTTERGVSAAPLNWVQRTPPLVWAVVLWWIAIGLLVWNA